MRKPIHLIAYAVLALALASCGKAGPDIVGGDTTDTTADPPLDSIVDGTVDPGDVPWDPPVDGEDTTDAVVDTGTDVPGDGTDVDVAPCEEAPPCPTGPADGVMGRPCLGDGACDEIEYATCQRETSLLYDGEWYTYYLNGSCSLWSGGTLACDPATNEGCPDGSTCIYAGEGYTGVALYGCFDDCSPVDSSGDLYDWACGCRKGYSCDLSYGVCFTGCSNDRECCETWIDWNGDGGRDAGEVTLWEDCSNWCDGDDPSETAGCEASYQCVNEGTAGALFGGPCEHDYQCPVDGQCWVYFDPISGIDYYPGGYCSRAGCQFAGRGCGDGQGWCMNTGDYVNPSGACMRPCHAGLALSDPSYDCRTTPGEEQACVPVTAMAWIGGAPPGGEDGYCFTGNFGSGTGGLGTDCDADGDCASPLGLGSCMDWFGGLPICIVSCSQELAEDSAICGGAGVGGVATGLCGWNYCWDGCDTPGGPLGSNGCDRPALACAPLSTFGGTTYVASGATRPTGYCMPACDSDTFCESIFGSGYSCDVASGVCS